MANAMMWADAKPDDKMAVWFFTKAVKHAKKSEEQGVPVFEAMDYVHVQQPGERDYQERPVKPSDKDRWPRQWSFYKEGKDQKIGDGTPLPLLFPQNPEIVEMLHGQHVFTVQQLAVLTAEAQSRLGMGGMMWVQKAEKFLAGAKSTEDFRKMQAELDQRDIKIAALENTVKDISSKFEQMTRDRAAPAPAVESPRRARPNPGEI
jgi:hypothetical protein